MTAGFKSGTFMAGRFYSPQITFINLNYINTQIEKYNNIFTKMIRFGTDENTRMQ